MATHARAVARGTQVISRSYEFAEQAPEEEVLNTILHEIAYAAGRQSASSRRHVVRQSHGDWLFRSAMSRSAVHTATLYRPV
jgi:hypothetical protein